MIRELENKYKKGESKIEMFEELFEEEKELHHYKFLLEDEWCKEIVINKETVYATFNIFGNELSMHLDNKDLYAVPSQLINRGFYEKEELELLIEVLATVPANSTFLDIGANLGWYGINVLKTFPEMSVYSFEAVPFTAKRMKDNFILNGLDTTKIYNFGLYTENVNKTFYYDIIGSGASSMADLRELPTTKVINVEMKRLDDCGIKFKNVEFIKCDVEGSELFVFKGGLKLIEENKPIIFSEMLRKWSAKFGYTPNDIINLLKPLGYECYAICGKNKLRYCPIVDDSTIETNYYFLDTVKHEKIIKKYSDAI